MCMCLARAGVEGVGGEWVTRLGLGFTNSGGDGEIGICVYVCCESGLSVLMAGPGICILC